MTPDDELLTKLLGTRSYSAELKANPAEREIDHSVVIAGGPADPETLDDAVKHIRQELDTAGIAFDGWPGGQAQLWKTFNPGSENTSPINELRNPTAAYRWARSCR